MCVCVALAAERGGVLCEGGAWGWGGRGTTSEGADGGVTLRGREVDEPTHGHDGNFFSQS